MEILNFHKGDDELLSVALKDSAGTAVTLNSGDYLELTIRELPDDEGTPLLQVTSTTTDMLLPRSKTSLIDAGEYSCSIRLYRIQTDSTYLRQTVYPPEADELPSKIRNWKNCRFVGEVGV